LNILAAANRESPNKLIGINDLLYAHYATYGRSFFSRYDYEEVPSTGANALVAHLNLALDSGSLNKTIHTSASTGTKFTVSGLYDFAYTDPIDHSVSKNQGQVITFTDGSRVVFRLSGTGSEGATVRMYVERYVAPEAGAEELKRDAAEGLKGLIEVALQLSKLKEFLGVDEPTVITVSRIFSLLRDTKLTVHTVNDGQLTRYNCTTHYFRGFKKFDLDWTQKCQKRVSILLARYI
jgi:phosphoglucomutase